jgi:hypothetical protein
MSRTLRSVVVASLFACLGGGALSACADNDSSLFIVGVLVPQPPDCSVTADPTSPEQLGGTLDVALRLNYTAALLVGNQLTPRGNKTNLKIETTRVNLRGAEVTLTDSQGDLIKAFSIGGTGFVDSNTGETPGFGAFAVDLIPGSVGQALATTNAQLKGAGGSITVYSKTRVFGDTLGGESLTSGYLTYPIEVCNGCLIQYPSAAITADPNGGAGSCNKATDTAPTPGCNQGEDIPVDCRNCQNIPLCQTEP